jgi:hypothetical protein
MMKFVSFYQKGRKLQMLRKQIKSPAQGGAFDRHK